MRTARVEKPSLGRYDIRASLWRRMLLPKQQGTLLDKIMPACDFRGSVSEVIHATPHQIFQALNEVTLADMPVAYALGTLRYLPGSLTGHAQSGSANEQPFLQLLQAGGTVTLAEQRDREIVLGSLGKYHQLLDQEWVPIHSAGAFARFHDPEYQKLAMAIRIEGGDVRDGYTVTLEHRTHALSSDSRKRFARYWLVIKPTGNFVSWLLLRAVKRRAERNS